ncbi:MAG: TonB-dependent receptor [Gemmatimonadaceae bacterium]
MKKITLIVGFIVLAAAPGTRLVAQEPDTVILSGVVISATKVPVPSTALTQSVTVITGEELRARGVVSVAEALRGLPGVAVASNGSYGSLTSLFLRGGESRYTKFLIDGVPVNAVGGYFDLSHLTTDNIERIEVVRGPASVVHGADAVSGVVQIFTRRGSGPARVASQFRGGTYGTLDADAGVSGGTGSSSFSLHGGRHSTDGILPFNNEYSNQTVSGSATLRPDARTTVSLSTRGTHAEFQYPTDFAGNVVDSNAYRDQRRLTLSLEAARMVRPGLELRALGGSNDVTDFTDDVTAASTGDTRDRYTSKNRRRRAEGRLTLGAADAKLTVGAEYQRERERSVSASGPVGGDLADNSRFAGLRTTRAAYAEYLASVRAVRLDVSGRLDDPSDFDRAATYRVGAAAPLARGTTLRGSVSTAYNAPAFYYLLDTDYTIGNPALSPERARNVEVALKQNLPAGIATLTATYFDQKFKQLIEYVPGGPPDYKGTYANLRAATSKGFEIELATAPRAGWSGTASFTSLKARVSELSSGYQGGAKVGDELLRRPRRSGSAEISYTDSRGSSAALTARYLGKRPDLDFRSFPSARVMVPSASTLDFAASIALSRMGIGTPLALTLRVDNLTDTRYQEVFNFEAPGRRILLGGRFEAGLR